ncbi:lipoprotein [Neisseria sp. P0008.S010]|nr:lipoprotein [Neisseria elongata]
MKKIVFTIAAAAILAACAAHHSNGGNELYGEIKGGVSVGHTHTR